MIITLENLRAGIHWWQKSSWPVDMHNADYYEMYAERPDVATGAWWTATVDRLWDWSGIRARTPPNSKAEISRRGQSRLGTVARWHAKIIASSTTEPNITDLSWDNAAPLFALAYGIKRGNHPVFASKMCHFLFPKLFIVMDHTVTGTFEYEFYWRGMKEEWDRFTKKPQAYNLLTRAIKSDRPILSLYPYETKIMELSQIGYNQRNNQR